MQLDEQDLGIVMQATTLLTALNNPSFWAEGLGAQEYYERRKDMELELFNCADRLLRKARVVAGLADKMDEETLSLPAIFEPRKAMRERGTALIQFDEVHLSGGR